ncbi:MAG: Excinuclease ABC subunit C [Parcubacteria group bacterium GW2011_GWC2_42_6]|nr:MAG: Excinuclease ABC subunit C [Parcubacteria group bacterium GW2011_GWC2_42_6]
MKKNYYVYILSNKSNTLYIGVTNNLQRRLFEHKNKLVKGFTNRYNLNKLIFYEVFSNPEEAISAEKMIKKWSRVKKINLIKTKNPNFNELII